MKTWLNTAGMVALFAACSSPLFAQWPSYPSPNVPKGPDGKPNLTAPAPKTPDGKTDFTGIWDNIWSIQSRRQTPNPPPITTGAPLMTFANIGSGFPDGLPLRPWAAELLKKRHDDNSKDNPDAHCLPMGLTQFHIHPQPRKIIQTPTLIVILYEGNAGIRQIYLDGRPLPNNDPQPWWYGYSVGRWDGAELVVETTGFRDDGWLDIWGSPLTEAAKLTERFRRRSFGVLEVEVTVDDPKAYTKPFTVRLDQRLMLDNEMIEFICAENERSVAHMVGK